jgi:ferredoxin-nitrite reductase
MTKPRLSNRRANLIKAYEWPAFSERLRLRSAFPLKSDIAVRKFAPPDQTRGSGHPGKLGKGRSFKPAIWHGHCSRDIDNPIGVDGMTFEAGSKSDVATGDFSSEQKRYLEGFVAGAAIAKTARGFAGGAPAGEARAAPPAVAEHEGPDAAGLRAQDRVLRSGGKLSDPEKFKREQHPFDAYDRLKDLAAKNEYPKPPDNFRWRYHGLFYVAPTQDSYMCRLRLPNGILKAAQFAGVADIAESYGGGYAHVTTRANLQIREIKAAHAGTVVEAIQELGLCSRGSGADNIRNVTGSPTAGIDPQELLDTRPYAREWHFHILNDRSLYGLPRKFNVAFDGGGIVPVLEDTNDIGFQAAMLKEGFGVDPGVWFRLQLGGITGHKDFARDTGVVVKPQDAAKVADAIVRVFIDHGDRTNRAKGRLKYVLDRLGHEAFLGLVEKKLGRKLDRAPAEAAATRPAFDRSAHIGVHAQKQPPLHWVGVVLPVGKLTVEQMRGLATVARDLGDGDMRLTVWQNLLISGVPDKKLQAVEGAIAALGLSTSASSIRAGLVACTGNVGCKFAASDTKGHAEEIAAWCESRVALDGPVNIHLTGCHHSCAQHYIGDIGLLACKVAASPDGEEQVEGYHILAGGGFGPDAGLGRELFKDVKASDVPRTIEKMLKGYLAHRASPQESFLAFSRRHEVKTLRQLFSDGAAQ